MDSRARGRFVAGRVGGGRACSPRAYAAREPLLSRFRRFFVGMRPARRDRDVRRTGRVEAGQGFARVGLAVRVLRRGASTVRGVRPGSGLEVIVPGGAGTCWTEAVLAWSEIRGLGMDLIVDPFDCNGGIGGVALLDGLEVEQGGLPVRVSDCGERSWLPAARADFLLWVCDHGSAKLGFTSKFTVAGQ